MRRFLIDSGRFSQLLELLEARPTAWFRPVIGIEFALLGKSLAAFPIPI
jgi:hypothetical protein